MLMISVEIPSYGDAEWLHLSRDRAYPSVLIQDKCEVVMHHEQDGTRASSLNNGANRTTGEWIVFLDADDEFAPGYVGAMRRALEQNTSDGTRVLFTPAVQQIRRGRPRKPFFFPECDFTTGNWIVIGTMINRAFFTELGGFRDHPHGLEDWNMWARAVRAGATVRKVPDAVYRAHVNPKSKHHELARDRPAYSLAYEAARKDAWG